MGPLTHAAVAFVLVTLTLVLQCAGMAALIDWAIPHFGRYSHRLGTVRSAALIVRFTSVMIALHLFEILLWAGFYRWQCFPLMGIRILFLDNQLFNGWLRGSAVSPERGGT